MQKKMLQPKKIYRYQRISEWTIENLCHDDLHFSSPASFNDPFDCKPTIVADSDKPTLREILYKLVSNRVEAEAIDSLKKAKLNGENTVKHAKKLGHEAAINELNYAEYYATDPEYECGVEEAEVHILTYKIQDELLQRYDRGICCFSTTYSNPLLWSHYADQHNGICIGYNLDRLPKPILHKVEYGGNRMVNTSVVAKALSGDDGAKKKLDSSVLLRKAPSWRYENEWRLFGNIGTHESTLALKDITFGLRCSSALIYSVIATLESRNDISFYEMHAVSGSFKLKRRQVSGEFIGFFPRKAMSGEEAFGPVVDFDDNTE